MLRLQLPIRNTGLLLLWELFTCTTVLGQTFPAWFSAVPIVTSLSNPTVMTFAPDGRIFVGEQNGKIKIIKNGTMLQTSFLELSVNSSGERGLIGIALHPDFPVNQYIYVYYTLPDASRNRISRFTANGDVVVPGSKVIILDLDLLSSATNHNGGAIHFLGNKLFVAVGENANTAYSQNLDTYHGKLLRINADGSAPGDNPFTTGSEQRKRIWSYGLRNPYTFDIQPGTGRIFVNDVGQNTWEEINDATTPAKNFGWPTTEGTSSNPAFINPVFAYPHGTGDGKGCAITGGVFFNPAESDYPSTYLGRYFFQDLCNQWINTLTLTDSTRQPFATGLGANTLSLCVGTDGNLYYLQRNPGTLLKIIYNEPPSIISQPAPLIVEANQPATFSISAKGTRLQYQWQKNQINIPGATNSTYTISNSTPSDAGAYRVLAFNSLGSITSSEVQLIVNTPPIISAIAPLIDREDFFLYPNPAEKFVTIEIKSKKGNPLSISVLDIYGKTIAHINTIAQQGQNCITLDLQSADPGCYLVRILNKDQWLSGTMMIIRK